MFEDRMVLGARDEKELECAESRISMLTSDRVASVAKVNGNIK
jgi:hypothetical protein